MSKAKDTMTAIYDDCYIQNKNLIKLLGFCFFECKRFDDPIEYLKTYIKL